MKRIFVVSFAAQACDALPRRDPGPESSEGSDPNPLEGSGVSDNCPKNSCMWSMSSLGIGSIMFKKEEFADRLDCPITTTQMPLLGSEGSLDNKPWVSQVTLECLGAPSQ